MFLQQPKLELLKWLIFAVTCIGSILGTLTADSDAAGGFVFPSRLRIVGGSAAIPHEFPWLVLIRFKRNSSREEQRICSASILNKKWVLTAAHCSQSPIKSYRLTAGLHNKNVVTGREQFTNLESIVLHPEYNPQTFQNDIALLKVEPGFRFTRFVKPIQLVHPEFIAEEGTRTVVAGWGTQKFTDNAGSTDILRKTETPVINLELCRRKYEGLISITEAHICTGLSGQSSCQGDSGSPVICRSSSLLLYLCGLVQGAKGCGDERFPQVNINVQHYLDWINTIIMT